MSCGLHSEKQYIKKKSSIYKDIASVNSYLGDIGIIGLINIILPLTAWLYWAHM